MLIVLGLIGLNRQVFGKNYGDELSISMGS